MPKPLSEYSSSEIHSPADSLDRRLTPAVWNTVAFALSLVATGGSLYLSIGLGLKACPLCYYQRSFAVAVVLVLIMQFWFDGLGSRRAHLVAFPLAVGGLCLAIFHVYLVQIDKLECPPALFGWGDGPSQSLVVFASLTVSCLAGIFTARQRDGKRYLAATVGALFLGFVASWACIESAAPLPPSPQQPYDEIEQPFEMCRPPFPGD